MLTTIVLLLSLVPVAPMPAPHPVPPEPVRAPRTYPDALLWFPGPAACAAQLAAADAHLAWLRTVAELSPAYSRELAPWIEEALALRQQWAWLNSSWAKDCGDGWLVPSYRAALRDSLGEEAWHAGRMLPPVPVWRYRRLP